MQRTLEERFWSKVEKGKTCWTWKGTKADSRGYGLIRGNNGKRQLVHRVAYELTHGKIPKDKWVLHACDNPSCVNPSHLFLGTRQDNIKDMLHKQRSLTGERNPNRRLTWSSVRQIRKKSQEGRTEVSLAKEYGVSQEQISNIVRLRQWKEMKT